MTFRNWFLSAAMIAVMATPAFADTRTEEYVEANANDVLRSLNAPDLDAAARRVAFQTYMDEFANLDAVAKFAVGKYSKRFTPEELEAYKISFRAYALAVYEQYFNEYRGKDVEVTGSIDRNANDSIVDTRILRADGKKMDVRWRVMKRGGEYQVVDVALNVEGNLIWLAIEQRAQFIALLDRTNGSAEALITKIDSMTDAVVARREQG